MIANWLRVAGVVSVAVAAGAFMGCGAQDFDGSSDDVVSGDLGGDENASLDESDLGTTDEALMSCSNPDGTNSVMAAFAVAVAQELGRWNASKDFIQNNTSGASEGSYGSQQAICAAGYAQYFGRDHLGAIRGASFVFGIAGAAFGPLPFAASVDWSGSYGPVLIACFGLCLVCGVGAFAVKRPSCPKSVTTTCERTL